MIKVSKIIVIGGNAAGPAAAAKAKRVNYQAEVLLFEAGEFISTGTCEIPYVLSGEISSYKNIVYFDAQSFYKEKGVKVYTNHFVEEIDRKEKIIRVLDKKNNRAVEFEYDKLVLATGSESREIKELPTNLENVFNLKSIGDLIKIQEYIKEKKVKNTLIIGSGLIGLETSDTLKKIGISVTILEREENPAPFTEPEIQFLIKELLSKNEISFYNNAKNYKAIISGNYLKTINLDSRLLEFGLVLVSAGFIPNTKLAEKADLEIGKSGAIKVDSKLRTSCQHIYAAGDNIEVTNKITNKTENMPLATLAHEFGHIAGANAAGENIKANPIVKNFSVKIFDNFLVQVGLTLKEAQDNNFHCDSVSEIRPNLVEVMRSSEKVFGKIVFEKSTNKILGASFFGGREVSGYGDLISLMIKTNQKADILSTVNYNYTPPLSPFVNLLEVLGRKIIQRS
ncbi:MAG TPA: FAD-dependent oxidoreductase [Ignavibacteriaceae bacterium]|nr:FAD-dependent oxidoreductase [Ignavibacteriaceae bacterium]